MSPSSFPAASLYAAVEYSPVGTLFFNQSFKITYANPAAAALLGLSLIHISEPTRPY